MSVLKNEQTNVLPETPEKEKSKVKDLVAFWFIGIILIAPRNVSEKWKPLSALRVTSFVVFIIQQSFEFLS